MKFRLTRGRIATAIMSLCAVAAIGAYSQDWLPFHSSTSPDLLCSDPQQQQQSMVIERITRPTLDAINVPENLASKMRLTTMQAGVAREAINLPSFQGVLALDNDRLSRIHTRFAGEIVELGKSTDGSDPELRVGEQVERGDLLAVIWSSELGDKKNSLVDALVRLRSEEQLRDRLKSLYESGAGAGRPYRDAERDVQTRMVEIAGLERALRTWRVSESELSEVRAEAQRLMEARSLPTELKNWARVEVRAPMSGLVLEKNVVIGDMVGTDIDLFKIGDVKQLAVWAHVYEEDLPLLESFPQPIPWTLTLASQPSVQYTGYLDKISAVIDPTQHTALVTGRVKNPQGLLKVGQFVAATVKLPPSDRELQLPSTAVVEEGRSSVVFVQPNPDVLEFVRQPVGIVRRLRDRVYISSTGNGLQAGDHVVTSGALMLQNAMVQLPAEAPEAQILSLHMPRPAQ